MEEKLFDIPVYICPINEFNDYWNKRYEKEFRKDDETEEEWVNKRALLRRKNHRKVTWMYHAIIGYIGVYKHGFDLFTTLSMDARERKIKGGIPDIYHDPFTFFRIRVKEKMTTEQVMDEFRSCMEDVSKTKLKNRYIDIEPFYNVCKYIDWHNVFYPDKENEIGSKEKTNERGNLLERRILPKPPIFEE